MAEKKIATVTSSFAEHNQEGQETFYIVLVFGFVISSSFDIGSN